MADRLTVVETPTSVRAPASRHGQVRDVIRLLIKPVQKLVVTDVTSGSAPQHAVAPTDPEGPELGTGEWMVVTESLRQAAYTWSDHLKCARDKTPIFHVHT